MSISECRCHVVHVLPGPKPADTTPRLHLYAAME